ncbi:MAG TPA: lamin tail domain-containing protein [Chitinophagaceae bacterium]|nr:lamin tail domain-containing protein [Chitinophagaceae bacterium]
MKRWLFLLVTAVVMILQCQSQQRFDVVITEIMADPTPQVGLPNAEYVEVKNVSGSDINLQGWRLGTTSSLSGGFPNYLLPADSFLILTTNGSVPALRDFGRVLGVSSFPSLPNEGTTLRLVANNGAVIHFVSYAEDWYETELKKQGGWSLEMVDVRFPCSGKANWRASSSSTGGTPGVENSVEAQNKDETPPQLVNAYLRNNTLLILQFNEPVDSASAIGLRFQVEPGVVVQQVAVSSPDFKQIQLTFASQLQSQVLYKIEFNGVKDCAGNTALQEIVTIGLPDSVAATDIIINEILFNPKPGGADYVELYNRSKKIIDAGKLYIANRNDAGALGSFKKLTEESFYIFPADYVVITSDLDGLTKNFHVKHTKQVLTITSMPSWPDDKGTVVVTNMQGEVVDEVQYSDKWHFELLHTTEGIALERIDPEKRSNDKSNWHSAASTAGYGTPTYRNSQYKALVESTATLQILPKVFSPDNDGNDDVAIIQYRIGENGYVANVKIFDISGRLVRHLVKNDVLGQQGSWIWNGLDENRQKLPVGPYVVLTEIFNLQGKKKQYKQTIVLARRLN